MSLLFRLLCLLPLLGATAFTAPDRAKPKAVTVYLVRHAEKGALTDPQNTREQPLSEAGQQRAATLAGVLRKAPLVAVYSTDTKRTRDTAGPLATAKKLAIQPYNPDPQGLAALAALIRQTAPGKAVLVVGHSNTVLETIEALGAVRPVKTIGDNEFSYLFEVKLPASGGPATTAVRRYGAVK
ncbi:phosphoglycerate mutase family protein [Hymenobacter coalescens]